MMNLKANGKNRSVFLTAALCAAITGATSGCGKDKSSATTVQPITQAAQSVDATPLLVSKIGGTRLESLGDTLLIGTDGELEYVLNQTIRYTAAPNKPVSSDMDLQAQCSVRFTGEAKYYSNRIMQVSGSAATSAPSQLEMTFQDYTVVASQSLYSKNQSKVDPKTICSNYAANLIKTKNVFSLTVESFDTDHLEIPTPDLNLPSDLGDSYAEVKTTKNFGIHRYFVKKDASVDLTPLLIARIAGNYKGDDNQAQGQIKATLNPSLKELTLENTLCETKDVLTLSGISATPDGLKIGFSASLLSTSPLAQQKNDSYCKSYVALVKKFADSGVQFDYQQSNAPQVDDLLLGDASGDGSSVFCLMLKRN